MAVALFYPGILAVASLGLWTAYGAFYRLYLSPLAKFPGPKLAALTSWYEIYFNCMKDGQFIWEIKRMHEQYGPIIRINPYEIHIDDPDYYQKLYAGGSRRDKYISFVKGSGSPTSTFSTLPHDHHRLRRSAISNFFSKRSIVATAPVITEKIDNLVTKLRSFQKTQTPINLRVAFTSLTLDIISDVCFGKDFGLLKPENNKLAQEWNEMLRDLAAWSLTLGYFPLVMTIMEMMPAKWAGALVKHTQNTTKLVGRILRHEDENDSDQEQNSIFHALRDCDLPPEEKTLERLVDEGKVLIGAGSETTAGVLSVIFYHLINNPPILARLQKELATMKGELTWVELEKLPYLAAVLNEGLRISSSVTSRLPRIDPVKFIQFQDWSIPPGTPVSMSYYFIHHNPNIFPAPKTFDPSRWLPNPDVPAPYRLENYLVPFSKGSRMCVGLNLAWAELFMATAILFKKFDFELFETDRKDVDSYKDAVVGMPVNGSKGVRVIVKAERESV